MSPLTSLIHTIHHGHLGAQQRELLIALLLTLSACREGMAHCPEMTPVSNAYTQLLAACSAAAAGLSEIH